MKEKMASKENRKDKKSQKQPYLGQNELYHANEGCKLQLRQKYHHLMKCTKKIRYATFEQNAHLCKSDLSPCSAPMCTYEKVH